MTGPQARKLIALIQAFLRRHDDLRALALCGSWARGNPRPDSDLDLLIIAREPERWRHRQQWVRELPFSEAGFSYRGHETATYGVAWSAHVALKPEAELELTFAGESWASTDPIDPGTRRVVTTVFQILVDKDGALERLRRVCSPANTR